ncbi:uncharacterized protein [Physcomitrium patens]|uniref:Arf-GAP domain-containing protein n=1 Tax=Physcomitrium patens TaxID=3218 RepID=A0A2K1L3B6_PHYPA|nr:probable ADP-ribosylation factor GTPase-activating protein AGD14 isoform X2 [Physcomitrium patens]PNR60529.1 hypothetical protein PHYPA_003322 [Physcomitrium patens]|eukprot:XP_024368180.1 probable ADP-ribosylation factor GTPase-activating protein AGD14 isoform X2 [Physcomitrella patens]
MHLGKMNSRVREDEKHEMIIRKLLKNTENKRCINCNSLGPQYVCTNFSIFVCTYCSGAHREFSHRIKSISMAKFTPAEVANLQSGGNGRAREIYFKELDLVRNPLPDSSDPIKLRNFINHVYVERRFTGERPTPTKNQEGGRDDFESRRPDVRKPGFQSPSRVDQSHDRRNSDRARKSDVGGYLNEKRSPNRFEPDRPPRKSYDDREGRRDEKVISEASRERAKPPVRPFTFRNSEDDGPPIRSVKEILGDDVPSLRVDVNGRSLPGTIPPPVGLANHARSQSLNHLANGESAASAPVVKRTSSESMISLIDFGADPEPVTTSAPVTDPFAPAPVSAKIPVSDPFAPAPVSANTPVVDLFGSDPFAVATAAKPVADPFAPAAVLKQSPDPFGFGSQGAGAESATSSWATFGSTGNPAPPEGYPGGFLANASTNNPTTQFSGGNLWDSSTTLGGSGWSAFDLHTGSVPALVQTTAPAPSSVPSSQQLNIFSTVGGLTTVNQTGMQMSYPQQPSLVDKLESKSSPSGRIRRELPQDFFAQPNVFIDARQDVAFSMGVGHVGAPQFPQRGQQAVAQPSRTRNPFDDDDIPPAPFNMGSMQAALPQIGDSLSGAASQWGQSIPQFQPISTPGGAFGYGMQSTSNMHQQIGQPSGFVQNQGFNQGAMYGGSSYHTQTAGSNPFG